MKNIDFGKFADKFIDDAHNLLNELEGKLLDLEKSPSSQELIESTFRAMHTLKGIGAMFGFNIVSEFTHHLETIYDNIRSGNSSLTPNIIELTFNSVDHLRNLLNDRYLKDPKVAANHTNLVKKIENAFFPPSVSYFDAAKENEQPSGSPTVKTWYIQFICSEELIKRAVNIEYLFQDLENLGSYNIFSHSGEYNNTLAQEEEMWGIVLTTTASYSEIEGVFMFVPEHVKIIELTEGKGDEENFYGGGTINDIAEAFSMQNTAQEPVFPKDIIENSIQAPTHKAPRISVGADKLDKLMYLVSELFTTRSELVIATKNSDLETIKSAVERLDKLSGLFRKNALSIRLVPLKEMTIKFKRLIRDLSKQLSKEIEFEVRGDDTELDKNIVDSLADPLMHIIRNCIDHGIEHPEERKLKNKPEKGVIKFVAYQSGQSIYVQISDDGKGIDRKSIREKAIEKGILTSGTQVSDKDLLDLIFLPGFSTAKSLTQVSGRGVGMDVVKRAITDLRGTVELQSEEGIGTTIIVKLQQTISILDTLLVRVQNSYFTIILDEVEICGLEKHQNIVNRHNNHLQLAGELIPYISVRNAFSIDGEQPETERIIVVMKQNVRYAILVDEIVGQYQAVVKPLATVLKHKDYLLGASIMGDGNIAFMLDTIKLAKHQNQ